MTLSQLVQNAHSRTLLQSLHDIFLLLFALIGQLHIEEQVVFIRKEDGVGNLDRVLVLHLLLLLVLLNIQIMVLHSNLIEQRSRRRNLLFVGLELVLVQAPFSWLGNSGTGRGLKVEV